MKDSWFGDSYDIVKRYFISELKEIGYHVVFDPKFMTEMNEVEQFYRFVGASDQRENQKEKSAVFLDPDTGIGTKSKKTTHITISAVMEKMDEYDVVIVFDQSFGWNETKLDKMRSKLSEISHDGGYGFYYDSHATFLFAAKEDSSLHEIKKRLLESGLPEKRLIAMAS